MQRISSHDLESQTVLDLPERFLMDALITISGKIQLSALDHLLNHYFHSWSTLVSADNNTVTINVNDEAVTDAQLKVFCTEASSQLSAGCSARLTN
jgi:hypothetical protein